MDNSTLISLMICVYNGELYIDKCIQSVVNQTYSNIEVLIIDDGSTDRTIEIIKLWAQKDHRIKVFVNAHLGINDSRNFAMAHTNGEVIAFVDADDYLSEDYLSENVRFFQDDDTVDMVQVPVAFLSNEGQFLFSKYAEYEEVINELDYLRLYFSGNIPGFLIAKLFRNKLGKEMKLPKTTNSGDSYLAPWIAAHARKSILSGKAVYYYVQTPNSITHSVYTLQKRISSLKMLQHTYSALLLHDSLLDLRVRRWFHSVQFLVDAMVYLPDVSYQDYIEYFESVTPSLKDYYCYFRSQTGATIKAMIPKVVGIQRYAIIVSRVRAFRSSK